MSGPQVWAVTVTGPTVTVSVSLMVEDWVPGVEALAEELAKAAVRGCFRGLRGDR